MAGTPNIPEALWDVVREQSRGGWSTRKIADWLLEIHDLKVSHVAVGNLLASIREEEEVEREAARAVRLAGEAEREALRTNDERDRLATRAQVREGLKPSIPTDLDELHDESRRLNEVCLLLYRRVVGQADLLDEDSVAGGDLAQVPLYLKAVETKRRLIDTKLKYAGADSQEDALAAIADAERRLLDKLAHAQREGEGSEAPGQPASPQPGGAEGG